MAVELLLLLPPPSSSAKVVTILSAAEVAPMPWRQRSVAVRLTLAVMVEPCGRERRRVKRSTSLLAMMTPSLVSMPASRVAWETVAEKLNAVSGRPKPNVRASAARPVCRSAARNGDGGRVSRLTRC
jgi:hypothetical protein